jgi:hypothetical protein
MVALSNQSHARAREHYVAVSVQQSSGPRLGADRVNVADHDVKGAETLAAPIAQGGESDLAIV